MKLLRAANTILISNYRAYYGLNDHMTYSLVI